MTTGLVITKEVHFRCARYGRKVIREGAEAKAPDAGRIPRVARLLALAIHMEDLVRRGEVEDYAELARLAHVTRARMTQIMNLLHLAPDIQEEILNLPRAKGDRAPIREKMVRPIAAVADWGRQRGMWGKLRALELDEVGGPGADLDYRMTVNRREVVPPTDVMRTQYTPAATVRPSSSHPSQARS
jgi:hypothetical protein